MKETNKTLFFVINGKKHETHHQYITGAEIRQLGNIPSDHELFLDIIRPWEDEKIENETKVDLARPGLEQFFSKPKHEHRFVKIFINDIEKEITRGNHSVSEIKTLGAVPANHELDELIDGKLVPLLNTGKVLIKGCERFYSHAPDGQSS